MYKKEIKRREKLADLFFSLANTTFGGAVIGTLVSISMEVRTETIYGLILLLIIGIVITIGLSGLGYRILNA